MFRIYKRFGDFRSKSSALQVKSALSRLGVTFPSHDSSRLGAPSQLWLKLKVIDLADLSRGFTYALTVDSA